MSGSLLDRMRAAALLSAEYPLENVRERMRVRCYHKHGVGSV